MCSVAVAAVGTGGGSVRLFRIALCDTVRWALDLAPAALRGVYGEVIASELEALSERAAGLTLHRIADMTVVAADATRRRKAVADDYSRLCLWTGDEWRRYDNERFVP